MPANGQCYDESLVASHCFNVALARPIALAFNQTKDVRVDLHRDLWVANRRKLKPQIDTNAKWNFDSCPRDQLLDEMVCLASS